MRLLYIVLLVCVISCTRDTKKKFMQKYGVAFNAERKKLGLPAVTPEMKVKEHTAGKNYVFLNKKYETVTTPSYVWKSLLLDDKGEVSHESDLFYNPQQKMELDYEHEYRNGETIIFLRDLQKDISERSDRLSFTEADSVLKAWGLTPPER
jgi:hypothetical protein